MLNIFLKIALFKLYILNILIMGLLLHGLTIYMTPLVGVESKRIEIQGTILVGENC